MLPVEFFCWYFDHISLGFHLGFDEFPRVVLFSFEVYFIFEKVKICAVLFSVTTQNCSPIPHL